MYKIYWTSEDGSAKSEEYLEMMEALTQTNYLRSIGLTYVTMVGQDPNNVGKMGVDSITNGKLPDGEDYLWRKRR
jgi:hypothetical protein